MSAQVRYTRIDPAQEARLTNLSRLAPPDKARAWAHIQAAQPALAEWLRHPLVRSLAATFNAQVRADLHGWTP